MITIEECKKKAKKKLSEKRYQHSLNVCAMAVKLAEIHGENQEKAAIAALLHDYCKELSKEDMLRILHKNDIIAKDIEKRPFPIWHGFCAAIHIKEKGWVEDEEILNAIAYHTTGCVGMTKLDKIIFLADMTSAERTWNGVDELRKEAFLNLDQAAVHGLSMNLQWLKEGNKPVDSLGEAALQDLMEKTGYRI